MPYPIWPILNYSIQAGGIEFPYVPFKLADGCLFFDNQEKIKRPHHLTKKFHNGS